MSVHFSLGKTAAGFKKNELTPVCLPGYLVTLAEALPGFSQWAASVDAGGISPVERPGMAREDRVDPNGNPVTIFGQTSSSSKTPGHAQAMVDKANEMVASGKYRYILYQRAWRTAVGQDVSRRIPDLVGITRDGIVDAFEVISNTDTPEALKLRLAEGMDSLPDEIQGSYDVIPPSAR